MPDVVLTDRLGPAWNGQPSEWLHKAQYKPDGPWGSNAKLKRASDVAGSAFDRLNLLHEFRLNPTEEAHQHAAKLKRGVDEFSRNFADQWQDVKTGLKAERQRVESDLTAKANLKPNPALLNATLGTFQAMNEQQRAAAIDELLEEGSGGPVLAILAETPAVLTGLTKQQKDGIRARAYAKADPANHALLQELDKALAKAERASVACIDAQMKLVSGTERFDKKVERSKQLENQLRSGFPA